MECDPRRTDLPCIDQGLELAVETTLAGPIAKPSSAKPRPNNLSGDSQDTVNSPIAGTIFELKCKVGDKIQINQELLIIEAMKMETSIAAPIAGTIKKVNVSVGDAVREGQALVQFE